MKRPGIAVLAWIGLSTAALARQDGANDAQPMDQPPTPVEALAVDEGLTTETAVTLRWSAPNYTGGLLDIEAGPAERYEVYISDHSVEDDPDSSTVIVSSTTMTPKLPGEAEELLVDGLEPGVTYFFAVRSQGWFYWSEWNLNGPVSVTTALPPPPPPKSVEVLDPGPSGPKDPHHGCFGSATGSASAWMIGIIAVVVAGRLRS